MKLCLLMIVKNESAIIERCLRALAPHLSCYVICDTGSTDGTQNIITEIAEKHDLQGTIVSVPFHSFGQARNAAFDELKTCTPLMGLDYDYILLADADMELVADAGAFDGLTEAAYRIKQQSSGLSYWNPRLVRRGARAIYRGVTHEYLETDTDPPKLEGVHFVDHADGANRPDKFERDIRMLTEELERNPSDARSMFYLAQSYRDLGQYGNAAIWYAKRAAAGGWDEEVWRSRLEQARCYRWIGAHDMFVARALETFGSRPTRAEPLLDLASFYREQGNNHVAAMFCEKGMAIPYPASDRLFIEDWAYTGGFAEEYAIVGYYLDPPRHSVGAHACNALALNPATPAHSRDLALRNLQYYAKPLAEMCPSWQAQQIDFHPPPGFRAMNPSVVRWGDDLFANVRTVNYTIAPNGSYVMEGDEIITRNFLVPLTHSLKTLTRKHEIFPPVDYVSRFRLVQGFEDLRLYAMGDELWGSATVRDHDASGIAQQVRVELVPESPGGYRMVNWKVMSGTDRHEKNWMPIADGSGRFVYSCDPTSVLDDWATPDDPLSKFQAPIHAKGFRGGSQAVQLDGGWLAVIHEVEAMPGPGERSYQHRFVWFDQSFRLRRLSRRFYMERRGIEFVAGLAWHPDGKRLVISYGANRDSEAWIGTVDATDVRVILENAERLAHGDLEGAMMPVAEAAD